MSDKPHTEEVLPPVFDGRTEEVIPWFEASPKIKSANNILGQRLGYGVSRKMMSKWGNEGFPIQDGTSRTVRLPGKTLSVLNPNTNKPHRRSVTTTQAVDRFLDKVGQMLGGAPEKPIAMTRTTMENVENA